MRGTVLDIVARRGHLQVVLHYPADAKEISWHNGQPVQRPYKGPSQLRFEQDFGADYDVKLAVTSWAKATFEVLNTGHNEAEWLCADNNEAVADIAPAAAAAALPIFATAAVAVPLLASPPPSPSVLVCMKASSSTDSIMTLSVPDGLRASSSSGDLSSLDGHQE